MVTTVGTLAVAAVLLAPAGPVHAQFYLPAGFSASYQAEYAYGKTETGGGGRADENEDIFENWLDVDYNRGNLFAGARFVAFQPPDPSVFSGESSAGVDLAYVEYDGDRFRARGGNFYALFGRGLALRLYEDRPLRVDSNALGVSGTYYLPDGELKALIGQTVEGSAEDADRERNEPVIGFDIEHGVLDAGNLRLGGSWATIDVRRSGAANAALEPLRMKAGRASATLLGVDLVGEFARVDGPNVLGAAGRRFDGPNLHGHGVYGAASTVLGSVGLVFEYKDYDLLVFRNDAGQDLIVPPAVLRDHTFNLLNRHPHQTDTTDERGFQVEVSWVTDRLTERGQSVFLANYSRTRNHEDEAFGNHFDDAYAELHQDLSERLSVIGGLSWQRSLASPQTPDPLRTLWTPIAKLSLGLDETYAVRAQFEHQHESSEFFGEFDTEFIILELTRSPDLSVGLQIEHSNKSDLQLTRLNEDERSFWALTVDYALFGVHDLQLFYGTRNAGFVCVGGVCRNEPAFDGFELSLLSRF
jgi:hypothetical protein